MKTENQLTIHLKENNVSEETALKLNNSFSPFFEQAIEWKEKAESINVTNSDQVQEMTISREIRLALRGIRTDSDKKRKELKEASLREGRAIDGMANIIKFLIVPIEEHLQKQEDFVKIQREKEIEELNESREHELQEYEIDTSFYNLGEMPEEGYTQLLESAKFSFETKKKADQEIERQKIEREKAYQEEQEKIRKDNERLKKEAAEREASEKKRATKEDAERKEREEKERKKQVEFDAKLKEEREKREKIERDEHEKHEKLKAEIKAKEDAERKEREKIEARQKAAELAPDKKKLESLAVRIVQIELPELKSEEAKAIIKSVVELLNKTSNYIKEKTINL